MTAKRTSMIHEVSSPKRTTRMRQDCKLSVKAINKFEHPGSKKRRKKNIITPLDVHGMKNRPSKW
jgi:hypothetical protein